MIRKKTRVLMFIVVFLLLVVWDKTIIVQADEPDIVLDGDNFIVDDTDYSQMDKTSDVRPGFSGGAKPTEEDILDSLNQAPKSLPTEPEEANKETINRTTWIDLDNISNFNYYAQLKNYTCGPACIRMAMRYIYSWFTESYLEEQCQTDPQTGTTITNMKNFMNGYFGYNMYSSVFNANSTTLKNNLYTAVDTYSQPPIVGVQESIDDGWPFDLNAHFVIVYSVKDDKEAVKLADPWAGHYSNTSPYKQYMMFTDDIYDAYDAAGIGYMY